MEDISTHEKSQEQCWVHPLEATPKCHQEDSIIPMTPLNGYLLFHKGL